MNPHQRRVLRRRKARNRPPDLQWLLKKLYAQDSERLLAGLLR